MKLKKLAVFAALFSFLALPMALQAQLKTIGEPKVLVPGDGQLYQNAVWAPDGSSFAFTSIQYQGIWVADKDGKNIKQLTDKDAGYALKWSSDSETILTRTSEYVNRRKQSAITLFDKNSGVETQLSEPRLSMSSMPQWAQFDEKVVLISDDKIETFETGKVADAAKQKMLPDQSFYLLKKNQLAKGKIPTNSTENISPFENATYLNLQVSPDGKKLAFEIYGGNLFVMNVDGTELVDLGPAYNPSWSPDSRYVVANKIVDDGHNITDADIFAFSVDGSEQINLTATTSLIALNPSWAPNGNSIIFDEPTTGNIYLLEITR
ncbi:MAG: hypothetical protein WC967_05565 [Balneolaceae bacterium]